MFVHCSLTAFVFIVVDRHCLNLSKIFRNLSNITLCVDCTDILKKLKKKPGGVFSCLCVCVSIYIYISISIDISIYL